MILKLKCDFDSIPPFFFVFFYFIFTFQYIISYVDRAHCSTPEKKGFLMRKKASPICKLEPSTKASIQKLKVEVRQLKQLVLNEAKKIQRAVDQVLTLLKKPNGDY